MRKVIVLLIMIVCLCGCTTQIQQEPTTVILGEPQVQTPTPTPAPTPTPLPIPTPVPYELPNESGFEIIQPTIPNGQTVVIIGSDNSNQNMQTVLSDLQTQIFNLTNIERVKAGLNALTYSARLQAAADTRAREIVSQFGHTRPDGSDCHTVINFNYYTSGENIILIDNRAAAADIMVDAWMKSEGHRENILRVGFKEMAVGVYEKDGTTYAVQIFVG